MKKFVVVMLLSLAGTLAQAQLLSFRASTGDAEMDLVLKDVDVQARADINLFKNDVSLSFNIGRPKIEQALLVLSPGDLFMAAQLSLSIGKPFETVVQTYKTNKGKGWGVIAKEMGIKPGSAEFHAMKKSMKSKGAKVGKGNKKGGDSGGKPKSGGSDKSSKGGGSEKGGKGNGKKK